MDEVNLAPTDTLNMEPTVAQPVGPSVNQEIRDSDDVLSSPHVTEEHPDVQRARYEFLQAERILRRVEAAVPENRQGASSDAGLYLAHKEYKRAARVLRDVSSYYEKKYAATAHEAANAPAVSHQPSPAKSFVSAFSPPSTSTPKKEGRGETATAMSSQVFRPFSPPFTQKQKGPIGTSTAVSSQVVQPFSPPSTPKRGGPVSVRNSSPGPSSPIIWSPKSPNPSRKHYSVVVGRRTGVYSSW